MFGANKRLRDLGKDTVDYTNYDSASAKVKRYRQQVYGKNATTYSNNTNKAVKPLIFFIIFFFVIPTILPFFFMFAEFFTIFDAVDGNNIEYNENNTIINEEETTIYKYEDYDVKWIKKYYEFFDTQGINKDNSKFAFIDLDFNRTPEVFYITDTTYNGRTYHINRVYFIDDYENVRFANVIGSGKVSLYYDSSENKFLWLSPTISQIGTGEILYLYRFDDIKNGKIFNIDYNVNNIDMFENKYSSTGFELKYYEIYDFDDQYYQIVDKYLLEKENINKFINDNNK